MLPLHVVHITAVDYIANHCMSVLHIISDYSAYDSAHQCYRLHAMTAGSTRGTVEVCIKDVKPPGATAPYASPEVLRSLKLQFEGAEDDEEGVMVNGCLADMWSYACILYEMLTGEMPFLPEDDEDLTCVEAPSEVPTRLVDQWLLYDAIAEAQRDWVSVASPSLNRSAG